MELHKLLSDKILSPEQAQARIVAIQGLGKKVVFTNGVFDILHPGHVDYLYKARDLGDFLVLGLNTDDSVRRLNKAPDRPFNTEQTRAFVLAGLGCIDAIVLFNEDTPLELITFLKPDVLVKGNDYKIDQIAGAKEVKQNGGSVITVPLVEGFSTTALINKIKNS